MHNMHIFLFNFLIMVIYPKQLNKNILYYGGHPMRQFRVFGSKYLQSGNMKLLHQISKTRSENPKAKTRR